VEKYKPQNKALFQEKMNLEKNENIPLFFWPNRLFYQKSPDLLVQNAEYLIKKYGIQIAIVANGDSDIEKQLKELSAKLPGKLSYKPFNEELSTLGKAGADFILMPSRYEPCGLPQMEAPRLGTLPVVRATGGLKDTVTQLDPFAQKGNGFIFEILDKIGFEFAVSEAVKFFNLPKDIKISNIKRIMAESLDNFNMQKTANKYMEIYDKLLENK
jgi:glycogen synthase